MQSKVISKGIVRRKGIKFYFLFFSIFIQASCVLAQTISLSLKEEPIEKAFRSIEAQTSYKFAYSTEAVSHANPITIQLTNAPMQTALVKLFYGQPLKYSIEDHIIMVKVKETIPVTEVFQVTGTITDEEGNPLQGVNVLVKGTRRGSNTDEKGAFLIKNVDFNDILELTMVGYQKIEIAPKGKPELNIRMPISVSVLDETIIKGYYSTSRRLNTGNVVKITADQIERQPVSNPLAALEGLVPGLFVTQRNGMSSSDFDVLIRGKNSIQNGTEPLYIIDGVPFPASRMTQLNLFSAGNVFNSINPSDIESIEVLKDADATAIYGSRGANGVILITTKKGVIGRTKVAADVSESWGRAIDRIRFMNTQEYLQMRHEAFLNDGVAPVTANARDLLAWDTTRYTDWKKFIIGGTAHTTNAQVTFSGGNELVRFLADAAYYKQSTVFPSNSGNDRTTINLSVINNSADKKFSCQISAGFGMDKSSLPQQDLTYLLTIPPNTPDLKDSIGKLQFTKNGFGFTNPLAIMLQTYTVTTERLTGNILLSYHLLSGLTLKSSIGYNQNQSSELSRTPIASQSPILNPKGSSAFGNSQIRTWIAEPQLEYNTVLGSAARIQFLAGSTLQENKSDFSLIRGSGYTNDNLLNTTVGAASTSSRVGNSQYRYEAVYTRLGFEYYKKYLLNLTARRDGSSRFGPGRQFANFGAIGASWIFSEEKAVKEFTALSFAKLRGSFGITGNQPLNDYQYLDTWSGTTYPYQGQSGLQPTRSFNPDYSWEEIHKLELAIDLGFFKDRFMLSTSWFKNRSSNQIVSYTLPAQSGFTTVTKNFPGVIQNTGLEFTFTAKNNKSQNLQWNTSLNLTTSRNRLVSFPGLASSSYANSYEIGKPLDIIRGYHYLGIDPQTGIYSFEDINKDNTINTLDYKYVGTTNPSWYGGLSNSIRYKNFQFDCLFQFVKQKGFEPIFTSLVASGTMLNNRPVLVLDRWQNPGDLARYQRYTQSFGGVVYNPATFNIGSSDAALVDASYLRLRNVSISWSLPQMIIRKWKVQSVTFYAQAQNLITFTKYQGPDPEVQSMGSLPPLSVISTGIKFSF